MQSSANLLTTSIIENLRAVNSKPSTGGLSEKLDQLMPSIWIMIATLGALCILIIILTKFLYKPVKKMVKNRQDFIQKNIDDSIEAKKNALLLEKESREELEISRSKAQEIISTSKIEGELIKKEYISQGQYESKRLIDESKQNIQANIKKIKSESHDEIVAIAIDISKKIINENIDTKQANKYLDEYLKEKSGK